MEEAKRRQALEAESVSNIYTHIYTYVYVYT